MELNDAQSIQDQQAISGAFIRCRLDHGCHTTSSRGVHFLAEEFVAELFDQFALLSWFVMQPG